MVGYFYLIHIVVVIMKQILTVMANGTSNISMNYIFSEYRQVFLFCYKALRLEWGWKSNIFSTAKTLIA